MPIVFQGAEPRRFRLVRNEDETGISGTGHIADGVMFADGTAVLRWRTEHRSTGVYGSIEELETIHGHGGKTQIEWLDSGNDKYEAWREKFVHHQRGFALALAQSLPVSQVGPFAQPHKTEQTIDLIYSGFSELFGVTITVTLQQDGITMREVAVEKATADWVNDQGDGYIRFANTRVEEARGIFSFDF